jgi:isoleucyl-tRNA synthetase
MAYNFNEEEKKILDGWNSQNIFEKSLEQTKKGKPFVFYDGPPFATGTPHYGHLLQSVIKDAIPRYKTMNGFYVERQWGWDCHGLPIENIVEKEIGSKSKKDILKIGVKAFNDLCRKQIFSYIGEWERIIPRFGRWADMKHPYRTMDFEYMQAEWWAFKELHNKGLIYEDYRSMHICPRCETTLSQGEVADGYKDIKDLSVTVKFKVKHPEKNGLPENTYFLAWTTTPWTLPGNVALAVGKDINYVIAQKDGESLVIAKKRLKDVLGEQEADYHLVNERSGKSLIGIAYEPPFNYYSNDKNLKDRENGWKVYAADFITDEDGTGIAHEAPTFGAEDWTLLKQEHLPFVQHVNMDGTFKKETNEFQGLDLKPRAKDKPEEIREADLLIARNLEEKGLLFASKKYEHSYPHCWRCDTALLNYSMSSWFVAVEKIKPQLLKNAKKITWIPEHIKEGRFGQWLAGARDWSISRQRFWANTIPVWRCEQCKKDTVFASAAELEKASGVLVDDLHKDVVDGVTFACSCGGAVKRVPDVLDTWFDSGSVPFATKRPMPADFIGEAQDQTRAWFYYMHVLAGALFGKEAFKHAVVTGIVLAEDGKKMSKKLKNYPDPSAVMEKYGADAMRFYLLSSPVVQAENLSFSEKGVDEIAKKNISRLYNVLSFYQLYKNGTAATNKSKNVLDQWILIRLEELVKVSTEGYENYQVDVATRPLTQFIDDLSVWYLRRSRDRFKEENKDKQDALATLRYVLHRLSRVMAPAMPFFAEYLFQTVKEDDDKESVHLAEWPAKEKGVKVDAKLVSFMQETRNIVSLALEAREKSGIKVKQPLSVLTIPQTLGKEFLELIADEVNVKEVVLGDALALDTTITDALRQEGMLREVVRFVQDMRKQAGLTPDDVIQVAVAGDETLVAMLQRNKQQLLKDVRGNDFFEGEGEEKELLLDGKKVTIAIKKI